MRDGQNGSPFPRVVYGEQTHLTIERDWLLIIRRIVGVGRSVRVLTPVPRSKNLDVSFIYHPVRLSPTKIQ